MVSRYAIVCDGQVVNVALWDGETDWTPDDGCALHQIDDGASVSPGWTFDGTAFAPPPAQPSAAAVPVQVTVDPDALEAARVAVTKATTVASLRTAVVNALALLTTEG